LKMCEQEEINAKELRMGSRRGPISEVRSEIAYQLVEHYGLPLAEIARHLGVSASAISKAITRKMKQQVKLVNNVPKLTQGHDQSS